MVGPCWTSKTIGRDRVYEVSVPDKHFVTATMQHPFINSVPSAQGRPVVYIIEADPRLCTLEPTTLACSAMSAENNPQSTTWTNETGTSLDVFVVADADRDTNSAFLIDIQVLPIP